MHRWATAGNGAGTQAGGAWDEKVGWGQDRVEPQPERLADGGAWGRGLEKWAGPLRAPWNELAGSIGAESWGAQDSPGLRAGVPGTIPSGSGFPQSCFLFPRSQVPGVCLPQATAGVQ